MTERPRASSLCSSLRLVIAVWAELAAVQLLWPGEAGAAVSFGGAACLILALGGAQPAPKGPRPPATAEPGLCRVIACARRNTALFSASFAAGFVTHPWIGALAVGLFRWLGGTLSEGRPPRVSAVGVFAALILAPCFEEALYRRRLLVALRSTAGTPAAVVGAALAFALPHLDPLRLVGCFLAGLVLGGVFVGTGRTWICVALHAGFNAAALRAQATAWSP